MLRLSQDYIDSGPVCVGQKYYLQCTYPDLQTCGYLPTILWQRNGVDIHPHSGSPEIVTFHNSTTAILETTYNSLEPLEYRCYYHDRSDTHFSNEVAVDYIRKLHTLGIMSYMAPLIHAGTVYIQLLPVKYCLLYTSPSPRDRQKSRMPSSA